MNIVSTWEELGSLVSDNYYIELENGRAWIRPLVETNETLDNYFQHHVYLSTHSFYNSEFLFTEQVLNHFGFNVKIIPIQFKYEEENIIKR